jgi:ABC-2 type transport system ATP-binding protein
MSKSLLRVTELNYEYGATHVLSNVNMELRDGKIALIVGRNGAGKSTLLRCLAGWTWPNAGTVEIRDKTLTREDRTFRRHVILVPDTPDFYDELTAWDHLQFAAQLHGIQDWEQDAMTLLENYGLEEHAGAFPFTFSRGMRYKLALCVAFLIGPDLLLLDEPFGPLDATSVQWLWDDLKHYREQGKSVLLSSHALPNDEKPNAIFLLHNQTVQTVDPSSVTSLIDLLSHVD